MAELEEKVQAMETEKAEMQNRLEDMEYDLSKTRTRCEKVESSLADTCHKLKVSFALPVPGDTLENN